MQRILLFSLVGLFIGVGQAAAQEPQKKERSEPQLIKRYEKPLNSVHRLEEDTIDLAPGARDPKGKVALRFCSSKPLKEVYLNATASTFVIVNYLKKIYEMPPERILFLRSASCVGQKTANGKRAVVETWVIPNGAALPPNDEAATLTEKGELQTVAVNKLKDCR